VSGRYFEHKRATLGAPVGSAHGKDDVWRRAVGAPAGGEGDGEVAARVVRALVALRAGIVTPQRGPRCERCAHRAACRAPDVVLEGSES
jgi:hypothetical protein